MTNRQLVLENKQAPGDILMFSCAVRDLHKQYPGQFITSVASSTPDIWQNSPYNKSIDRAESSDHIRVGYSSAIHQCNFRNAHFSTGFCQELGEKLGTRITLTDMRADLHFTPQELDPSQQKIKEPYWVVIAGGKSDFTAKVWDIRNWQTTVTELRKDTQIVQAGGGSHNHKPLNGVINMVGRTTFREFMLLIKHSQGVICPITCAMHLAAACNKPCVVIAGGREGWWWEAYTRKTWAVNVPKVACPTDFVEHTYLHTIDKMSCCTRSGCWLNGIGEQAGPKNCKQLERGSAGLTPACLQSITPALVADSVRNYMAGRPVVTDDIPVYLKPPLFTEPLVVSARPIYVAPPTPKPKDPNMIARRFRSGKIRRFTLPVHAQQPAVTTAVPHTVNRPILPAAVQPTSVIPANMGKVTIAVILYGNFLPLAQRCLTSIYRTVTSELFELRIGMNSVSPEVRDWVNREIVPRGNVKVYDSQENLFKYPMMHRMFWSEPKLNTEWVIWFDDDSHVYDPKWLTNLNNFIGANPDAKMIGKKYFQHLKNGQVDLIHKAPWYKQKQCELRKGAAISSFATGGYWAARTSLLKDINWPWVPAVGGPLLNNGGDVMLGSACWQQGVAINECYQGIAISDSVRRGASHKHPGV